MIRLTFRMLYNRLFDLVLPLFLTVITTLFLLFLSGIFFSTKEASHKWVRELHGMDLWVYPKKRVSFQPFDQTVKNDLAKLKVLEEVEEAAPFCQKFVTSTLPNGVKRECVLFGIDEVSHLGAPKVITQGKLSHLYLDNTMIVNEAALTGLLSFRSKGKKHVLKIGQYLNVGKHKLLLGAISRDERKKREYPLIYTSYKNAERLFPEKIEDFNVYFVKVKPGVALSRAAEKIEQKLGLEVEYHKTAVNRHIQGVSKDLRHSKLMYFVVGAIALSSIFYVMLTLFSKRTFLVTLVQFRQLGASIQLIGVSLVVSTLAFFIANWILVGTILLMLRVGMQDFLPFFWLGIHRYIAVMLFTGVLTLLALLSSMAFFYVRKPTLTIAK